MISLKEKYIFKDLKKSITKYQNVEQSNIDDVFTFGDGKKDFYKVNAKTNELTILNKVDFLKNLETLCNEKDSSKGLKDFYQKIKAYANKTANLELVIPVKDIKMDLKLGLTLQMADQIGIARQFKINATGLQVIPEKQKEYIAVDLQTRKDFFMKETTIPNNIVDIIKDKNVTFGSAIGIELFNQLVKNSVLESYHVNYKSYGKDNCKIYDNNREDFATKRKIDLLKIGDSIYVPSGSSAVQISLSSKNIRLVCVDDEYMIKFIPDNKKTAHSNICIAGLSEEYTMELFAELFYNKRDKIHSVLKEYEILNEHEDYLEPNTKVKNNTVVKVDNLDLFFNTNSNVQNQESLEETENKKDKNNEIVTTNHKYELEQKKPNFILIDKNELQANNKSTNVETNIVEQRPRYEEAEIVEGNKGEIVEDTQNKQVDTSDVLENSYPISNSNISDDNADVDEGIEVVEETPDNENNENPQPVEPQKQEEANKNLEVEQPDERLAQTIKERDEAVKKSKELEEQLKKTQKDKKYFNIAKSASFILGLALFCVALVTANPYLFIAAYIVSTTDNVISSALVDSTFGTIMDTAKLAKKASKKLSNKLAKNKEKRQEKRQRKEQSKQRNQINGKQQDNQQTQNVDKKQDDISKKYNETIIENNNDNNQTENSENKSNIVTNNLDNKNSNIEKDLLDYKNKQVKKKLIAQNNSKKTSDSLNPDEILDSIKYDPKNAVVPLEFEYVDEQQQIEMK